MPVLPRTIPDAARQELADVLAEAGVTLGPLAEGRGNVHTVEHQGTQWRVSYLGRDYAWALQGPGCEHVVGAVPEDIRDAIARGEWLPQY